MAKDYSVFISHSWDNTSDLTNLQSLLKERGYFNIEFKEVTKAEPIDSVNAQYIKRTLKNKITDSDIVIGLAGMYASHSDWMDWELQTAVDNEIPIFGVIPRGNTRSSNTVTDRSKTDVKWNTESIVSAIRAYAL